MDELIIGNHTIAPNRSAYLVAELSANHGGSLEQACETVCAMKEAGADAVKLRTYTADTITIRSDRPEFRLDGGTLWDGRTLYDLYEEAHTPWEWHERLFQLASELEMDCFSTPFDRTAVDFLEELQSPAYKVASFELVDLPLIEYIASKEKPVIMSTGMGTLSEIAQAVQAVKSAGVPLALLKCTSAYPSPPECMNLRTIPHLSETFDLPAGLSDHTMGTAVPVAAVTLGACIIEKHFTLSRKAPGPDSAFSLEPHEFKSMVESVRAAEAALGRVSYDITEKERANRGFRRSLFVVDDVKKGERFTTENVRSIRPGLGLPPSRLAYVLERIAACDIDRGTPLAEDMVS